MAEFGSLNWAILIAYIVGNLILGYFLSKRVKTAQHYFIGQRTTPLQNRWGPIARGRAEVGSNIGAAHVSWACRALDEIASAGIWMFSSNNPTLQSPHHCSQVPFHSFSSFPQQLADAVGSFSSNLGAPPARADPRTSPVSAVFCLAATLVGPPGKVRFIRLAHGESPRVQYIAAVPRCVAFASPHVASLAAHTHHAGGLSER